NHQLIEVQRVIGANILPARVLRSSDLHAIERAFGAIQSLLFEFLPGYQGVDVADRGADPEADAVLTVAEVERLVAAWEIRRDKRDPRYAFFRDPDGGWHTLRWTGLPPEGEVPAFGDARREQLLRAVRQAGLMPKSDAELLPVLLELAGAH